MGEWMNLQIQEMKEGRKEVFSVDNFETTELKKLIEEIDWRIKNEDGIIVNHLIRELNEDGIIVHHENIYLA